MKKTLFLVIFTLFCIENMYAQTYSTDENITESDSTKTTNTEDNEDEYIEQTVIHYQVTYPEFPGGMSELMKFIQKNMQYPKIAIKKGIEGRVICQFTVTKDGSIEDIIVVRGLHKSLDKEAVRVIKKMPKWKPGKNYKGEVQDCKYTIPITFKLPK